MKNTFITLIFVLLSFGVFAQKGSINGVLLDSASQKTTLNYATISVFKGQDTVLTTYKLSDEKGAFKILNLEIGVKYRLVINAWMYNILRKEVVLNTPSLDLGNLLLTEKTVFLNEVVITSERPPIIVRKDTIEFNAGSFKTLPSAVVEDLLKKLPGVAIASDGSIKVNGKTVNKILVDGKEFFGGDQQIATKNLPANIIDKIQVTDDQQAKRQDPNLLAGNTPQVINLKLKKGIKQGAFGKVYAGGGSKELYEAGGIMNFFRDTTQVSFLSYSNNANRPGFNVGDIARIGGFERTGINSAYVNEEGNYFVNDVSFGGSEGGRQTSSGVGTNFNTLTKKGLKINGMYFFGLANNSINRLVSLEQTLGTDRLLTNTDADQINKSFTHSIASKIEWKPDSLSTFIFEPRLSLGNIRNLDYQITESRNGNNGLVNDGINDTKFKANNLEFNLGLNYWKDSKKVGRTLNISSNINKSNRLNDNFNLSTNNFYDPLSNNLVDQLRDNNISNFGINVNSNYAEPIGKKLAISTVLNGSYLNNENALFTFYKSPINQSYDIAVPTLSETVAQSGIKSNSRTSLRWKPNENFTVEPGLVLNTINLNNSFKIFTSFNQNFKFLAPSFSFRYKDFNLDYTPSFYEPDVRYIQPVENNSNPLFIQKGNPNLRPTKSHQISFRIFKYDTKTSTNYWFNAFTSLQNDAIIMSRIVGVDGVQINTPVNANGIYSYNGGGGINKDIKNGKNQFSFGGDIWTTYQRNIVLVNDIKSFTNNLAITPKINGRINLNDHFEFAETYSLGINKSTYDNNFYSDFNYLTHNSETEMVIRYPKKLVWETSYKMQYNTQSVAGYNNNINIWNAGVTLLFMKNDKAQLKFSMNDILNTNTRRFTNINENTIRNM